MSGGRAGRAAGIAAAAVWASLCAAGCAEAQRAILIHAPNYHTPIDPSHDLSARGLRMHGVSEEFRVECGPPGAPAASIRVWVFEPTDQAKEAGRLIDGKPRGTVLALYGYRNSMSTMSGVGEGFAAAGYRAVMMDLRGHGRSSGDYITYGVHESADMRQVIAELDRRGLIAGKLGLWGISMGGATALMAAADEGRVATVVSVASYTTMRAVVPHFAHNLGIGAFETDQAIQQFIEESAAAADFDPDKADAVAAMRRLRVPVLILHGAGDEWVPADHGRQLWEAAPAGSKLLVLPYVGHLDAHFDIGGEIEDASVAWFDEHLRESGKAGKQESGK